MAVNVGGVMIGSDYPIRVQSMTNTNTNDIEASVAQCKSLAAAGAEIVRLTAQGVREAQSIGEIRTKLRESGCNVPLVADIHFNPKAAFAAAAVTDKVRINRYYLHNYSFVSDIKMILCTVLGKTMLYNNEII